MLGEIKVLCESGGVHGDVVSIGRRVNFVWFCLMRVAFYSRINAIWVRVWSIEHRALEAQSSKFKGMQRRDLGNKTNLFWLE